MNNEETIVMKPQTDNKAEQAQNVETMEKKSNKGKKVAATAAAAVMGGVVGSGATYAATTMLHDKPRSRNLKMKHRLRKNLLSLQRKNRKRSSKQKPRKRKK